MQWPLLEVLNEDERRAFLATTRRRRFDKGEVVFHEGDPGDTLHLVAKGHFGIRMHTTLGDVAMVRVLGPGEFFGELTVVSPGPRIATASALSTAETLSVRREQFAELELRFPKIDRVLIEALVTEIRRLSAILVEVTNLSAEKRIWRRIDSLRKTFGVDDEAAMTVPITQEDLAELAGCTRPTVNQVLKAGELEGIIALGRGRIVILDADLLDRRLN